MYREEILPGREWENLAEEPHANDLMTNLDWLLKNLYNQEYK